MNLADQSAELIHEMRNRLTVARANVEAFIDGKLPPSAERLGAVLQSLNQIDELLKDFRASAAVARSDVQLEEIDVCAMLAREYQAVEAVATAKGIAFNIFRCPVPTAQCTHFVGDRARIGQVITNLLLNAVRYTPAGGSITVDCGRHGGELEILIADTGPGIAPNETGKIFEAGYRGTAAKGTVGSGYGLAIAKEFVESQGGSIAINGSSEKGASFTLRLPGAATSAPSANTHCEACTAARRQGS
jgi:two-component system sensor histidine kinase BaeS